MIYEFQCKKCNVIQQHFRAVDDRDNLCICDCGEACDRMISNLAHVGMEPERDTMGQRIWFPKDNKPYFDKALRRTFHSAKEKKNYLKEKDLVMDGSSMPSRLPIEAGEMRNRSYRRENRLED